jgi:hypothetical protein
MIAHIQEMRDWERLREAEGFNRSRIMGILDVLRLYECRVLSKGQAADQLLAHGVEGARIPVMLGG